jgi:uncharacterized protein (TIGR02266 family)
MAEQRKSKRKPLTVELRIRDTQDPHAGELVFETLDLSADGAFLRSDLLLEAGDEIEISFRSPKSSRPFTLHARVAWAAKVADLKGEPGMGVEFVRLDDRTRRALMALLK